MENPQESPETTTPDFLISASACWARGLPTLASFTIAASIFSGAAVTTAPIVFPGAAGGAIVTRPTLMMVGEGKAAEGIFPLPADWRSNSTQARRGVRPAPAAAPVNNVTTINVDARGSSDPAAVEAAARRGAIIGLAEARRATTRTTGRSR